MTEAPAAPEVGAGAGLIEWGDTSFVPEPAYGDRDPVRRFIMSKQYPQRPFDDRRFQLYGKERIAFLEETLFWFWSHRYSVQHMGSGVNGTRRCTLETLGRCLACEHYEANPPYKGPDGKDVKPARCGRRQQQFGVNILVYKTNEEAQLLDEQNRVITLNPEQGPVLADGTPAELVYETYLWRFSADKFAAIKQLKQDWSSLLNNDITCVLDAQKPENFQDFTVSMGPHSAWRLVSKQGTEKAKEIVEYYKEHRYDVEKLLGGEPTHEDVQRFLNLGGAQGQPPPAAQELADAIASELQQIDAGAAGAPPPPPAAPPPPPAAPVVPEPAAAVPPPAPPPAAAPAEPEKAPPPPAPPAAVSSDFDDLLK